MVDVSSANPKGDNPSVDVARKGRAPKKGKAEVTKSAKALERLEVVYAPIGQIRANSYNPNRQSEHDFELLLRSISEDGFTQPIVAVKTEDPKLAAEQPYTIVDGEHRWRAAAQLGYQEIPLALVPMTEAQAKIATLRHNRARGSEDIELATEVLRDLQKLGALDWAADSLMLSDDELNKLLEDIPAPEALAGDEFSEAWTPNSDATASQGSGQMGDGTTVDTHATPGALQKMRDSEAAMAGARTEEERQAVQRDRQVYRVALQFTDEEALDVKKVLGDRPAVELLRLCREDLTRTAG